MKINAEQKATTFDPVTVTIVIESQKEFDALYALGNYSANAATALSIACEPGDNFDHDTLVFALNTLWSQLNNVKEP